MKQALLIGCGNIGFRHLQALAALPRVGEVAVTIVEPDTTQHDRIRTELTGAGFATSDLRETLPDTGAFDLAIIATNSNIRRAVFDAMVAQVTVAAVIFEKVLFQTEADLDAVGETLRSKDIAGYVNCGRRGFPGYQALAETLAGDRPLALEARGSGWAMASNAIHLFDIAACLNGSALVSVNASGLEAEIQESKRGGYKEVFGTLTGELANGAVVTLTCLRDGDPGLAVRISGTDVTAEIAEAAGQMTLTRAGTTDTRAFETRHVSQMPELYAGPLFGGGTALTPYAESADQHRLLLRALRPHLGLSNAADDPCPIS